VSPTAPADEDTLVGEVSFVLYTDDRTGFGVVEVTNLQDTDRRSARATGPLARLTQGQPVALHGRWTTHPTHGETFAADWFAPSTPVTVSGLEAFLAGEHFPGIGARLAAAVVSAFGLHVADVVEKDPDALIEVPGITDRLRDVIVAGWRQAGLLGSVVARLGAAGIPAGPARWLVTAFGEDAPGVLDRDPYVLLDAPGIGWHAVERLASAQGVEADDPVRHVAAATWVVRTRRARDGDVAIGTDDLLEGTARMLGTDPATAATAIQEAVAAGALDAWAPSDDPADILYALPADAAAEADIAAAVARLDAEYLPEDVSDADVAAVDADLTAEQRAAVRMAFGHAVSVLTGGPGTGKTRTVAAILAWATAADRTVALCAPTGRAAKRLEELTGHRATTIHRLLEARPSGDDSDRFTFTFAFDEQRRLPHDLIVADEWSMADVPLARALLVAIADGSHVVVVGDVDQLPPVGPGAVLRDLLEVAASPSAPVASTALRTVHRQAARSRIITLAHELKGGVVTPPRGRDGDVFAVPQATAGVADRVAEIVAVRAPAYYGCGPADVQVLAPRYGGPAGVDRLNDVLRDRLNPRNGRATVAGFCEGDRVVQTRNNPDLGIANGEVGEVAVVDPDDNEVEVVFDTGGAVFGAREARDLRPAWCLTVHKSQGGQWPVVILVLDGTHGRMLWRELVYTAVTRAVDGLLLVGAPQLLAAAARRTGSGIARRRTSLARRLTTLHAATGH
jgi:exodeoxyribonuclease V alpha subunit